MFLPPERVKTLHFNKSKEERDILRVRTDFIKLTSKFTILL